MRTRPALVLALAASLVTAGGIASAAPKPKAKPIKPVCNVVTDPKGDTFAARSQDQQGVFGPQEDGLDILSADLASDGKTLTGVIRLVSAGAAPTSPGGRGFDINITTPNSPSEIYLRALVPTSGAATAEAGTREALPVAVTTISTPLGAGTAVVDAAKNEVRFSFPTSLFASVGGMKVGDTLSFGEVTAGRTFGPRSVFADVVVPGTTYKVGTPSCVAVGK